MVMPVYLDNSLISQGILAESASTTKRLVSKFLNQLSPEYKENNRLYLDEKFYLERPIVDSLSPCG